MTITKYFQRTAGPDGEGEKISRVAALDLFPNLVVTAVRDSSGKLKLISWRTRDLNGPRS